MVRDVDDYLAGGEFQVETWEIWVSGTSLMFLLSAIGSDLPLRHDMMDFMEFARQI